MARVPAKRLRNRYRLAKRAGGTIASTQEKFSIAISKGRQGCYNPIVISDWQSPDHAAPATDKRELIVWILLIILIVALAVFVGFPF